MQKNAFKVMSLFGYPFSIIKIGNSTFGFKSAETILQSLQASDFQILKEWDTQYTIKDSRQWLTFEQLHHEDCSIFPQERNVLFGSVFI